MGNISRYIKSYFVLLAAITVLTTSAFTNPANDKETIAVRKTLDSLYSAFGFKMGGDPDWTTIRHLALNGAAFVSAPAPKQQRVAIDIEKFISDYKSYIVKSGLRKTGYTEHILSADIQIIGTVSVATVVFKASIAGDKRPRKSGMDNLQLLLDKGRWKIMAFTTQAESEAE